MNSISTDTFKKILRKLKGKIGNNSYDGRCRGCEEIRNYYEDILSDPSKVWLYQNRDERMDASLGIFNEMRRVFHLDRYNFACNYTENKIVADIACGTGYGTELLHKSGNAQKVYGIDISSEAIAYAKKHHHCGHDIEYICASGTNTALEDASIDVVVSFETIEHVEDDVGLIKEFARILKPGGKLVCSTPNRWPLALAVHHVKEYDERSFTDLLASDFEVDQLCNQNSGDSSPFNHGQTRGIVPTTVENAALAECYIAVCKKH